MSTLSSKEFEDFKEALLSAFPNEAALQEMVKLGLSKDLAKIASGSNLGETTFKLINWAETFGETDRLIRRAHKRNPKNALLDQFYRAYIEKKRRASALPVKRKPAARSRAVAVSGISSEHLTSRGTSRRRELSPPAFHLRIHGAQQSTYAGVSDWLDHFGFVRSPFERLEAGSEEFAEPGFLSICFVDPDCFHDILGQANAPITQILYARRGEGKTACRVMIDYFCQHGSVPDYRTGQSVYVLSVPHIHMKVISAAPDLESQVVEMLRRAVTQLADLLGHAERIRQNIIKAQQNVRTDINWFIDYYGAHLNLLQMEVLSLVGFRLPFDSAAHPALSQRAKISPLDHLTQWCRLMNSIDIQAVYVLVDGLDELTATAADPNEAYRLLSPLITNRELIDKTPYFAMKLFLPPELEGMIRSDKAARPELIPAMKIRWSVDNLKTLLRERISYFRDDDYPKSVPGFEEFCAPELYGAIEDDLIRTAEFNPRFLLYLCDLLVKTHCAAKQVKSSEVDPYHITSDDLQVAKQEFEQWKRQYASARAAGPVQETLDIHKILAANESTTVEFKSSLLRNLQNNERDDSLIMKIGKEIAGMLNTDGGTLLIGIGDDKSILGIESDYEFLGQRNKDRPDSKKQDADGFQLKLVDLIRDNMGAHVLGLVEFRFESLDDKTICAIIIQRSPQPVYFGKLEEFYIRRGSSNIQLKTHELVSYVSEHWPK
jgi:hypothetical protein